MSCENNNLVDFELEYANLIWLYLFKTFVILWENSEIIRILYNLSPLCSLARDKSDLIQKFNFLTKLGR